ncbi:hypothetical protein GCM10023322_38400 [Rugosimonospora acidiphila]|uniref:PAS domain-containing protein n=1 Tax=Rugosimonospora acidiphila TaxID=556531 RepID=A0ABP9RVW7_9ACTN
MSSRLTAGYTALMALLGASVFAAPGLGALSWAAIGLCSAAAVVVGVRRFAPSRPLPWWVLAAAILAMGAGDTIYGAEAAGWLHAPALADICYLAMFPLMTTGLIQMARSSAVLVDWSRMLDLLTFTCAAALLSWMWLVTPGLGADNLGHAAKSVTAAYALGDLLILVTTVGLAVAAGRNASMTLLALGAIALLAADVWYALATLGGGWHPGGPAESPYLLLYYCWGAAALRPSMVRLTQPVPARSPQLPIRSAALLGLSLSTPPAVLLVEASAGQVRDGVIIGAAWMLMSALVITRLAMALSRHRQTVDRQQQLRRGCGTLVAASDIAKVDDALRAAVGDLMPAGLAHTVLLAVQDPRSPGDPDPIAKLIKRYPLPHADQGRTRLVNTRMLHPELGDRLDWHPATLVCRLAVDHRDQDDPELGALLVAGDGVALAAIQDAVEVLAAQASLALERIALTDAINRRSNEEYLRAATRNSIDAVIIVDGDRCVRYTSPALADIIGSDVPILTALRDIVHPDDHEQIERTLRAAHRTPQPDGARAWWHLPRPNGGVMTVEVSCRDLRHDRRVRGYVITMRDLAEQEAMQRESIRRALSALPAAQNRERSHRRFG